MPDTVRAYGAEWLAAAGDEDRLRGRHRDWYAGLTTWCEPGPRGPVRWTRGVARMREPAASPARKGGETAG